MTVIQLIYNLDMGKQVYVELKTGVLMVAKLQGEEKEQADYPYLGVIFKNGRADHKFILSRKDLHNFVDSNNEPMYEYVKVLDEDETLIYKPTLWQRIKRKIKGE